MKSLVFSAIVIFPLIIDPIPQKNSSIIKQGDSLSDTASIINSNNQFAFELYKKLSNSNENLFFSPFSISTALTMLYAGSNGETRDQMRKAMNIIQNDSNYYKTLRQLNSTINYREGDNTIDISNALWVYNKLNVEMKYKNILENYFGAELRKTDFVDNPIKSRNEINDWIIEKTDGRINNIIDQESIKPTTRMIITNAIYFNIPWENKFLKSYSKKDIFFNYGREKDSIWFMNNLGSYNYFEDNRLQILEIPYKLSNYSMIIFLPKDKKSINNLEIVMDYKKYLTYINLLQPYEVTISIPKFKFNALYELNNAISEIGASNAFNSKADFSGITTDYMLQIDKINHSAFIAISEDKTEAAASNAIRINNASSSAAINVKKKTFKALSPFIFMINYKTLKGNQILFIGKIQTLNFMK